MKKPHITSEEIEFIRQKAGNHTSKEIAKMLKRSQCTIIRAARNNNIKYIRRRYVPTKLINNDFFKTQTPEMAYILGFIAADGSLSKTNKGAGTLRIKLAIKDEGHLRKLAKIMGFTGKFYIDTHTLKATGGKKEYKSLLFAINSKEIYEDLLSYNITPRKSFTLKWPDKLQKKFIPDFIRGYFDGDGWLKIDANHTKIDGTSSLTLCFNMVGTLDYMTNIKEYVNIRTGDEFGRVFFHKDSPIYEFAIAGNMSAENFGKIIYYDENCLKLDRKYKRFKKWLEIKSKSLTKEEFVEMKSEEDYRYNTVIS